MPELPRFGLWLHPRAPAEISAERPGRVHWGYNAGADARDFERVATVRLGEQPRRIYGTKLERYGLIADPSRQFYGWGGPFWFYADFERRCVGCTEDFLFTARAQRFWYEERGAWGDAVAIRCEVCRRDRRHARVANRRWQEAKAAWEAGPESAPLACALAEAGLTLLEQGGGTQRVLDDCVGALRAGASRDASNPRPQGWLARVEAARGRADAAQEQGLAYLERTQARRDKGTKALRKAVERELARIRQAQRVL